MMLADLGAEVVRVERPGQAADKAGPVIMRGRRPIILDAKRPDGLAALLG